MKRSRRLAWLIGLLLSAAAFAPFVAVVAAPAERSYAFVPDHPIGLWHDGQNS